MNEVTTAGEQNPTPYDAKRFFIWGQIFRAFNRLVTAGLLLGLAYFAYKSVEVLAGKETLVDASLSLLKSSYGLPWLFAVLVSLWAVGERRLRYRKTESMEAHIRELERHIDPGRTSSGLLRTGQSNPGDG